MMPHEIQEIFRELPTGSFTVHIVERTPIEIPHTDFAMLSPDGGILTVWDAERHLHHIHAASITRISQRMSAERTGA